ncbi:maltokinase N-terminal cap-like domain-containing protein, partial [Streptomyces roseochromogenus]
MPKTITVRPRTSAAFDGPLVSLSGLLREWLPGQRWFAGKDRPVTDLSVLSVTELFPGCLHVLMHASHAPVPTPGGTSPPGDCYQLLLGLREQHAPRLERAFIGRAGQGPFAGLAVYDALHDPRSAHLLLERLRQPGTAGPLRFDADPGALVPGGLPPRLLDVEQSNSSIVYGDAYILKVFRRIQPGVNPDLEVTAALAAQGCTRVPAPVAWFGTTAPQPATLGVLQPFLPDATDGWTLALRALAAGDDFTAEADELGGAMAEVHLALAEAFGPAGPNASASARCT